MGPWGRTGKGGLPGAGSPPGIPRVFLLAVVYWVTYTPPSTLTTTGSLETSPVVLQVMPEPVSYTHLDVYKRQ